MANFSVGRIHLDLNEWSIPPPAMWGRSSRILVRETESGALALSPDFAYDYQIIVLAGKQASQQGRKGKEAIEPLALNGYQFDYGHYNLP